MPHFPVEHHSPVLKSAKPILLRRFARGSYLDLVLAMSYKSTPQSLNYFFRLLDVHRRGRLSALEVWTAPFEFLKRRVDIASQ